MKMTLASIEVATRSKWDRFRDIMNQSNPIDEVRNAELLQNPYLQDFNKNQLSNYLSRCARHGYIKRVQPGVYKIISKMPLKFKSMSQKDAFYNRREML